jgi:NAD(P)-dependent dehydrogenase (short-subunit alcohol dehydrogenase family)
VSTPASGPSRALIAGATGAIGRRVAAALVGDGWSVVLGYGSREDEAARLADEIRAAGGTADVARLPLEDSDEMTKTVRAVAESGLDGAVYAAGPYVPLRFVSQLEPDEYARFLNTDAVGCFRLLRAALPALRESSGAVVALTTVAVARYAKRDILSAAPKAAVEVLVRAVAAEEGRFGVRANCVGVGMLRDGMVPEMIRRGDMDERYVHQAEHNIALHRLGRAEEVAEAVRFLLSPQASYISGQSLYVDGGYAL